MVLAILHHVPAWVWILLAAIIALGISLSKPQRRTLRSAAVMPIVMLLLSINSVGSLFAWRAGPLAAWALALGAALALSDLTGTWRGMIWSAADRRLIIPGSWLPLILSLGLFLTKFSVNVVLAMTPGLARAALFAGPVAVACGAISGLFLGRGLAMLKVVQA